jgi:GntR family transcriptional regulator/MocR family aminotransferase
MSTWKPTLFLDPASSEPVYRQIAQALIREINRGRLNPGDPLPGYRALGEQLGISRNTVMAAYRDLQAEGWVVSTPGEGSVVALNPPTRDPGQTASAATGMGFDLPEPGAPEAKTTPGSLFKVASGLPDPRLLPGAELARAYRRALTLNAQANLLIEDPQGHPRLREALAQMLASTRGMPARPDQILITRGSQMALFLASQALLQPGDGVAVEALGPRSAWEAFAQAGARCIPIPVDGQGMRVEALAEVARMEPLRAVYLAPTRHYPTLVPLSAERRARLLALAREHRFAILENAQDAEFQFEGRALAPLAADDPAGVVVHIGTLSKIFSPNLRLGFVHGPVPLVKRMTTLRQALDRQGDMVLERAFAELIDDGEILRHLNRMQLTYRRRRDALCESMQRHLGERVRFSVPEGGLALWAEVADGIDVDRWAARALEGGVAFRPGRAFAFDGGSVQGLRIGFSNYSEPELEEVALRMATALQETP